MKIRSPTLSDCFEAQPDRAVELGERPVAAEMQRVQVGLDQRVPAAELLADQLFDRTPRRCPTGPTARRDR